MDAAGSKLRFRLRLSLAWSCPQYAISDGRFRPSLRGKKVDFAETTLRPYS
ncbi:MAG: hypothetical protein PUE25_04800 [bacterium]|nr:hypothetical protein [bacterium]